ncbi:MAG: chorismate synthase, partial [Oscillospiraceae bacterium]|nr:chorismate synthase [Oscillospiraceae bacterium]
MGSIFGRIFRVTTWGESHGKGIGAVVDGCPAGLELTEEDIQKYLDRRKPGQSVYSTPRSESDAVEILSGVFEGQTTGTPIALEIRNKTQRSADYSEIAEIYRPGHADFTFDRKYGIRDYRGGGRSSGRETAARVAAGAVAAKIIGRLGITVKAYTRSIGDICIGGFDKDEIFHNPLYMPDKAAAEKAQAYLDELRSSGNSAGGVVECVIKNVPVGLGDPVFDKLDADLAKAMLSIGAAKGFEIGEGMNAARLTGLDNNDGFVLKDGDTVKSSNHSGGVLGGMSDGSDIVFRVAFKPTPSISSVQHTVDRHGNERDISVKGRHDPIIVPRAVVVVETMAAIVIADKLLENMTVRMDRIEQFYR